MEPVEQRCALFKIIPLRGMIALRAVISTWNNDGTT